jgi:sulfopyruvate decarboxylase subunit alpha
MTLQDKAVETQDSRPLTGASIISAIKRGNVEYVAALPDIVTCDNVLWPVTHDPDLKLVTVCKEDEGVSICAGLSCCDRRAVLLIQHTGFLDSVNAIRAIAVEYGHPVIMIVGLQGMEADCKPVDSGQYGIRILEPILQAMGMDYALLNNDQDTEAIVPAINKAYANSTPFVFLVVRSPG